MTKQKLIKLVKQSYDIHGVEEFYDEIENENNELVISESPTWIEIIERWNWFRNTRKHLIRSIMRCKEINYLGLGIYELTYDDNRYQRDIYKIYSKNINFSKNRMSYKRRKL